MGFMVGLIVTVVGFILALAVHPTHPGSVNVNTVGWIMVVVGLIASSPTSCSGRRGDRVQG